MGIRTEITQRLSNLEVDESVRHLVIAALSGPAAVEATLAGKSVAYGKEQEGQDDRAGSVYLQSISVTGFRGIGEESTLTLDAHPGLTLVVGRNGSGKSSFFDALEVLLTGDSFRWKGKTQVWKSGWRNLHQPTGSSVSARFQTEGVRGTTVAERRWEDNARSVADAATTVQHLGQKRTDLDGVAWAEPLELYRPLLSHPELSSIAVKPSGLFDTFNTVLGLEEPAQAIAVLARVRLERQKQVKSATEQLKQELLPLLEGLEDERAQTTRDALSGWNWKLDQIQQLLSGDEPVAIQGLQALSGIELPTAKEVTDTVRAVEEAHSMLGGLADSQTHRANDLADLLEKALSHHQQHGEDICPVCNEGSLGARWQAETETRIIGLRADAHRYQSAKENLNNTLRQARRLTQAPQLPTDTPVDTSHLAETWRLWGMLPQNPAEAAAHLSGLYSELCAMAQAVSQEAGQLLSEQEKRWAPIRTSLRGWLPHAQVAMEMRPAIASIKKAETALGDISEELRTDRWAPIERQALRIWNDLRLQSNIDLDSIALTGKGPRRRVEMTANVDGEEFSALGVASQGELNCLALSLFFPRGTLPQSPFRFLIIDDPVQAMDPARVDGLAKVFDQIASDRQLVVFTHDDRLPEALRRLDLPHRVLEVSRNKNSSVKVRSVEGPVNQYLADAWAIATDENLPEEVSLRLVPGFCRQALEAACLERYRRDQIAKGVAHALVEREIDEANTLIQKAALALTGDIAEGRNVRDLVTRHLDRNLADVLGICNRGTHKGYPVDLRGLIDDCRTLAKWIRNRP